MTIRNPIFPVVHSPALGPLTGRGGGGNNFAGGNQSADSLDAFGAAIAALDDGDTSPTAGGTLTINSQSLGSYDYVIFDGDQTITSFNAANWFTSTEDSRSAIIIVKGNLTIDVGQTLIPSVRKLFTMLYVTGTLTVNGAVSMSARGADHSAATGSSITATAIRLINGTHGGVSNPQVPASGGAGGAGRSLSTIAGLPGAAGSNGATGGGGSGGGRAFGSASVVTTGTGATGTSFGGGPGSGGVYADVSGAVGDNAGSDGGVGGDALANVSTADVAAAGGAGNDGGANDFFGSASAEDGDNGTGGVLYFSCSTLSGSGQITANGADGGSGISGTGFVGGAGSGAGSITGVFETNNSSITPTANGGAKGLGNASGARDGGAGGAGTARLLERDAA